MAAIDVAGPCTSHAGGTGNNWTNICLANPANDTGTIDYICSYNLGAGTVDYATFFNVSGANYSTRDSSGGLTVADGLNEFNAPADFTAFDATAGDYAGYQNGAGGACRKKTWGTPVGTGHLHSYGDKIPCTNENFGTTQNYDPACYFEGTTAGPSVNAPTGAFYGPLVGSLGGPI